jgi:hypothetical protein
MIEIISKPLTWNELADIYKAQTNKEARIRKMETIMEWALNRKDLFDYNKEDDTIHLIERRIDTND